MAHGPLGAVPVSRMVLSSIFARVIADDPASSLNDLAASLSDKSGRRLVEVINEGFWEINRNENS
jgi:hypothetical protein